MPEVAQVLLPEGITGSGTRSHAGSCTGKHYQKSEQLVVLEVRTGSRNRKLYR